MTNVIDLAAVRAARKAPTCTFELFGVFEDFRRPQLTDIVSIGVVCDYQTGKEIFALASDLRAASLDQWSRRVPLLDFVTGQRKSDDTPMPPVEFELDPSGSWWVETFMTYGHALTMQQHCAARGARLAG